MPTKKCKYTVDELEEAVEIIRLLVDHKMAGRITIKNALAGVTYDRAQIFLAEKTAKGLNQSAMKG